MGPIEISFVVLLIVFAVVGVVRGYPRELGVTTMLFIALFVLEFLFEKHLGSVDRVLNIISGQEAVAAVRSWTFVIVLLVITFVSYQGQTLTFPGKGGRPAIDFGTGLLNGYLVAGSIWYYLQQAAWPGLPVTPQYTPFYQALVKLLPPAVFTWPYFIGLAVILLIARVWK